MKLTWEVLSFTSRVLTVKLNFLHPDKISQMTTPSKVKVLFNSESLFRSANGTDSAIASDLILSDLVPEQIIKSKFKAPDVSFVT